MATYMIWHLAQLVRKCGCHIMQPICHTVMSVVWQQTVCSDITKVIVAKRKNCVRSTMKMPHCTDCNMATDMMWQQIWYGIWHNRCANVVAILCSQFTTLSYLHCGNKHCVHILFATWLYNPSGKHAHSMCTLVAVQCSWMPKLHWLPIVATIKVWKL